MRWIPLLLAAIAALVVSSNPSYAADQSSPSRKVGVAAVDITPDYPILLSGFAVRTTESDGATHKIWAKAIAIGDGEGSPALIVTVDNLAVPDYMTQEVAGRLQKKAKIEPARFTTTSTHTHSAPMLTNVIPNLFGKPIPSDQQKTIDRYTRELTDKLEQVALAAIAAMKPATVEFGIGEANFAINRRSKGGPVDHDLPVLAVRDPDGKLKAIYLSYACHCVTLADNKISGDWAGYVEEMVNKVHPGVMVLTSVGCGADSNPSERGTTELAAGQGQKIADAVERLLKQPLAPISAPLATKLDRIELMFATPPTREEFEKRAQKEDYIGYHAKVNLARLDRGEELQKVLSYPVQTWTFGNELAMVFLPGEVVADYSLRLKREFDRNRLWVNGYSNDVPCYIPSERVLKEGGYEGAGAMVYYDRPGPFAPGLEQKIIDEVHKQLPETFRSPKGTEGTAPRSGADAVRTIRTKPGLEVELVAAEPLVTSPVAIDWGADGKLWVCEMYDYPVGLDGNWQPGGRVKFLEDTDNNGSYDKATIFLEGLPFPTGVTAWGKGVLVCAAPDIIFAQDTNGDGKADKVDKLFTGFITENYQARVNSLSIGLDNYLYGANGLLGGVISGNGGKLDIRSHDFRFRPLDGKLETVTGLTQQGRVRDDLGRWFGCDNSNALAFYPHEQRYISRNPNVPAPAPINRLPAGYDVARIYPISRMLERFNTPESANRFTSGCGLGIYRDTLLGDAYYGNAFSCEPVHNLVHRMVVRGDESTVARSRAEDEKDSEFLASTDNWFRPVQMKTGPDGAMYVVDMYRFLIEHPRWIPAERLAQLDARAGADMGRIYRIRPAGKPLRPIADLTKKSGAELAATIDSPNGTERDRVQIELLTRQDAAAAPALAKLAATASLPVVRIQALSALDAVGGVNASVLQQAFRDADPQVRKQAIRQSETLLKTADNHADAVAIGDALIALMEDASPAVRHQLVFTLGEWNDKKAGAALAKLARAGLADDDLRIAVLSSAGGMHCGDVLAAVMEAPENTAGRAKWIPPLVATAVASQDEALFGRALAAVLPNESAAPTPAHFDSLASLLDAIERKNVALPAYLALRPELSNVTPRLTQTLTAARQVAGDAKSPPAARASAMKVLGRGEAPAEELDLLCRLAADSASDATLRDAAIAALRRQQSPAVADRLLANWKQTGPSARTGLITLLIARDKWATALLKAVEGGKVGRNEIPLAEQKQLQSDTVSPELRKLATAVFPAEPAGSRAEVLKQFTSVGKLTGDASKGAELFAQNCAACHQLNGVGHPVGPDLSILRDKDADYYVKNILDPSAIVEPRFTNYQVILKGRRVVAGVMKAETSSSLTLEAGGGVTETVDRADVKDIRASQTSMMPEGFEAAIPPEQMAHLIAYMKSTGARKTFAGNTPKPVAPAADGSLILPANAAEISGDAIAFETQYGNIGWWHGQADQVAWATRIDKAGKFDIYFDYACAGDAAGNAFAMVIDTHTLEGKIAATGPNWDTYKQTKMGTVELPAGPQRVIIRPTAAIRGALMDLRAVAIVPTGAAPKWPTARPVSLGAVMGRDPVSLAKLILDPKQSQQAREAAVNANPQFAAELIAQMTADLIPGTPEEYVRIPWIWRVSIACGKRNEADELKQVIATSLPAIDAPLHDWQSVVIGGGVINGISQRNVWPAERVAEILAGDDALLARWTRSIDLAAKMADDEKVKAGTRYDALRMLGVQSWEQRGEHLARYLGKDVNHELQMGAVSGLADVNSPKATEALIGAFAGLAPRNRELALDALLRDDARTTALLQAIENKTIDRAALGDARVQRLLQSTNPELKARAEKLLKNG